MTPEERHAELLAIVERDGRMLLQKAHEDRRTLLALVREMRAVLTRHNKCDEICGFTGELYKETAALLAATEGV